MMTQTDRIAQWENMTQADPSNAMGWFSLGSAYREADRPQEAAHALQRAIELDGGLSRAYQLLAQVLLGLNHKDQARDVLTRGFETASRRGDVMPQRAMESLLRTNGWPVPEVRAPQPDAAAVGGDQVLDQRTGRPGTRLPDPPMRGPLGRYIYAHYSAETWREWIGMGTKVINELRLDFSNPAHQELYEQHMKEWLGVSDQQVAQWNEANPPR
jgi:Fe-S cluster biosynthesis and repair protein YggX